MKAQWIVLIVVGGLALIGLAAYLFTNKGPDLGAYLPLKEPRIARMDRERVLEVQFDGPADTVIKQAYSVLFKAYFGAKGSPKGPAMRPPKARYTRVAERDPYNKFPCVLAKRYALPAEAYLGKDDPELAKRLTEFTAHDWKGSVAIPVPDSLVVVEGKPNVDGMRAKIAAWDYGDVAEILHLGPYETEPPTIKKLTDYIAAQGFRVVGDHEEEYLKGPGMAMVAPKDYWTIIRYRVEKAR
jgi:effector-binding domain-containing protein